MALPQGWQVVVTGLFPRFDATGAITSLQIDYQLVDGSGVVQGGSSYFFPISAAQNVDPFEGNGSTATYTTTASVYDPATVVVEVAGQPVTPTSATQNANGTVTVTLPSPPPAGAPVRIRYDIGPGLDNRAANVVQSLGLSATQGTVYASASGAVTAAPTLRSAAALFIAWAQQRVLADRL